MSYSIVFETKIIKLKDGRILHLDLSGCNNDNAGRDRGDFTGKIYTEEDFLRKINDYKEGSRPYKENTDFIMKIGSRMCSMYDYGTHLERMLKRTETWEELCNVRYVSVKSIDGVNVWEGESKSPTTMSLKEFNDYFYKNIYSGKRIRFCNIDTALNNEEEIVNALDAKKTVSFYIGKLRK